MLQLERSKKIAIIDKKGTRYSFSVLHQEIELMSEILIALNPRVVAIKHDNDFYNAAAVIACLNTRTNFIVLDKDDNQEVCLTKLGIAKDAELIFSDNFKNKFVMGIDTHTKKMHFGTGVKSFVGEEKVIEITDIVRSIFKGRLQKTKSKLRNSLTEAHHICFHKGYTQEGFRYSGHLFEGIQKGIIKASLTLNFRQDQVLVYMEKFDLLHNIINGIVVPLMKGVTVKFCSTEDLIFKKVIHKNVALYTSATVLESQLEKLKSNILFKNVWGISSLLLKKSFEKHLGASVERIIIGGKITKPKLLNTLRINKISSLYTMCEVASFVAIKKTNKFKKNLSIGTLYFADSVEIATNINSHGSLVVYTVDMAVHTNYAKIIFNHRYPGRINTEDACYFNNKHEIVVLGKSKLTFESEHGKLVDTSKFVEFAKRFRFVKNVLVISNEAGALIMLIEPDYDWADHRKFTFDQLLEECEMLNEMLMDKFKKSIPIRAKIFEHSEGIGEQLFKIATRRG